MFLIVCFSVLYITDSSVLFQPHRYQCIFSLKIRLQLIRTYSGLITKWQTMHLYLMNSTFSSGFIILMSYQDAFSSVAEVGCHIFTIQFNSSRDTRQLSNKGTSPNLEFNSNCAFHSSKQHLSKFLNERTGKKRNPILQIKKSK